jgi:predicted MFS family arabinose efflux permease
MPIMAADYYGRETGTVIYGWIFAAHQLESGAAAFLAGYMYEHFHSYTITFLCAGVLCMAATLFVIGVKKKKLAAA